MGKKKRDFSSFYHLFLFKFKPDSELADKRFKSLYPQLKKAISKNEKGIDLACGTGQLTFLLKKKGYDLEGLDNNSKYLDLAKEYAKKEGYKVNFYKMDLKRLNLKKKYDYALFLGNTLPHFGLKEFEKIAKNISCILTKKGKLIIDFNDWVELFRTRYPDKFLECEKPKITSKHQYFDGKTGVVCRKFMTSKENFNIELIIWAPYILDYVMENANFKLKKHFVREGNRYISVYEKK